MKKHVTKFLVVAAIVASATAINTGVTAAALEGPLQNAGGDRPCHWIWNPCQPH